MKKIGIISDTHGFIDLKINNILQHCDEVWHAGDFGFSDEIENFIKQHKVKGVYGNIDGDKIRQLYPQIQRFTCEKIKVLIKHIGGYPKKYSKDIEHEIKSFRPDIYICGHSHILKIMYDKEYNLIHINPGAAGREGFHKMRTIVLLQINEKKISNVQVIELGPRSKLTQPIN